MRRALLIFIAVVLGNLCFLLMIKAAILRGEGDTQTNTSGAESPRELRELTNMAVFQAGLSKPSSPWPWEALKKRVRSGRLSAGEVERLMEGLVTWVQGDHPDRYHSSLDNLAHFLDELDDQDLISEHDKLEFLTALYGTLEIRPLPRLRQGQ
jgi:hypothetical protein